MSILKKKQSDIPRRRYTDGDVNAKNTSSSDIFRRNRTLTGTTSNHLGSANSTNNLESPRVHAHNLSIKRRKALGVLLVIFISAVTIWVLVSNFTASVKVSFPNIVVPKNIDLSKYEKAIQNYLDSNPTARLKFFLDPTAMTEYISAKLPEIKDIKQGESSGVGITDFEIFMREPVASWQINNKQYFVDSMGIPFQQNYFSSPPVKIVDNSGISVKIGTSAIASNRFLAFVGRVVSLTKAQGYTVTQAALPANTTRELEIHLMQGNNVVKLSIDRPAGEQVEDMVTAVKYFATNGRTPQYIDVRVGGKAFYK